jgi:hypothetical protein
MQMQSLAFNSDYIVGWGILTAQNSLVDRSRAVLYLLPATEPGTRYDANCIVLVGSLDQWFRIRRGVSHFTYYSWPATVCVTITSHNVQPQIHIPTWSQLTLTITIRYLMGRPYIRDWWSILRHLFIQILAPGYSQPLQLPVDAHCSWHPVPSRTLLGQSAQNSTPLYTLWGLLSWLVCAAVRAYCNGLDLQPKLAITITICVCGHVH